MIITAKQLLQLPVWTQSGIRLGRVVGFGYEAETQTVLRYEVRRSLFGAPFLVGRDQVVSLDTEKMVVEDAVVRARRREVFVATKPVIDEQPGASFSSKVRE
jgi:hypothetical protein